MYADQNAQTLSPACLANRRLVCTCVKRKESSVIRIERVLGETKPRKTQRGILEVLWGRAASSHRTCPPCFVMERRWGLVRFLLPHMTVHLLSSRSFLTLRATRAASVKASLTPRFFMAEHSRYRDAPIRRATSSPWS